MEKQEEKFANEQDYQRLTEEQFSITEKFSSFDSWKEMFIFLQRRQIIKEKLEKRIGRIMKLQTEQGFISSDSYISDELDGIILYEVGNLPGIYTSENYNDLLQWVLKPYLRDGRVYIYGDQSDYNEKVLNKGLISVHDKIIDGSYSPFDTYTPKLSSFLENFLIRK